MTISFYYSIYLYCSKFLLLDYLIKKMYDQTRFNTRYQPSNFICTNLILLKPREICSTAEYTRVISFLWLRIEFDSHMIRTWIAILLSVYKCENVRERKRVRKREKMVRERKRKRVQTSCQVESIHIDVSIRRVKRVINFYANQIGRRGFVPRL